MAETGYRPVPRPGDVAVTETRLCKLVTRAVLASRWGTAAGARSRSWGADAGACVAQAGGLP